MKSYLAEPRSTSQEEKLGMVSKQVKICVACGNTQVEEYDFGITCNNCGTSFYFGRVINEEVS